MRFFWVFPFAIFVGTAALIAAAVSDEIRTSEIQSEWFSWYGRQVTFAMQSGANPDEHYPKFGPYNERLGYSYLPFYIKALRADDFTVAAQMRASPTYDDLLKHGFYPVYHPKTTAGLTMYGSDGETIYATSYPKHVFDGFDQIPPLLVDTLLYIENRDLLKDGPITRNPVVEWNRLFYAVFGYAAH